MKEFHTHYGIGNAKYVVDHHDGEKKHSDGSDFFDIAIFRSKKEMARFVAKLQHDGYTER